MNKITLKNAAVFFREQDNFVILMHVYPDGDTVGSAAALCAALRNMGKNAYIKCSHEIPKKFGFVSNKYLTKDFDEETVIAVDVADNMLLGSLREIYGERVDLSIDHHGSNTGFAKETFLETCSANCENIYNLLCEMGCDITKDIANALFLGLSTDTGCFKYASVTSQTHIIAAKLIECGADAGEINRVMFDTKTKSRMLLEQLAFESMTFHFGDRCAVMVLTNDIKERAKCTADDLDGISALPRSIEGVTVGVTVRERGCGKYKISLRTHAPVDASKICATLGGGGHPRAAGCEIDGPCDAAKQRILDAIDTYFKENNI